MIADLRQLAQEAKRPDNLITGWISGPEHPAIRDATENVAQQLNQNNWRDVLTDYEVLALKAHELHPAWANAHTSTGIKRDRA